MDKKSILFGTCCWLAIAGIIASGICIAKDVRSAVRGDQPSIIDPIVPVSPSDPVEDNNDYWDGSSDTSWYDAEDIQAEYVLNTPEEFAGFSELSNNSVSFSGVTVKLGSDMFFNRSLAGDELLALTPISSSSNFDGVFDGQGYSLHNLFIYSDLDSNYDLGVFGRVAGMLTNFGVDGIKIVGRGRVGAVAGTSNSASFSKIEVKDANLNATGTVGGLVGSFTSFSSDSDCSIVDCNIDASISHNSPSKIGSRVGGVVGFQQSIMDTSFVLSNCVVNCAIDGFVGVAGIVGLNQGSSFVFENNDVSLSVDFSKVLSIPNSCVAYSGLFKIPDSASPKGCIISSNVIDATFNGVLEEIAIDDVLYFSSSFNNVDAFAYWGGSYKEFDGISCSDNVKSLSVSTRTRASTSSYLMPASDSYWDGSVDVSWFDENDVQEYYVITTASQLAGLAEIVNNGFDFLGVKIYLGANIYLNASLEGDSLNNWTPIGGAKSFSGNFIGSGYTINNLYISGASYSGLFGKIYRANLSDFKLDGVLINGASVGSVAYAANYSRIQYVNVLNATLIARSKAGGLVANTSLFGFTDNYCWLNSCSFNGAMSANGSDSYAGGLIGYGLDCMSTMVQHCTVDASISGFSRVAAISSLITGKSNHFYSNEFNLAVDYLNSSFENLYSGSTSAATWGGYCTFNVFASATYVPTCYMSSNKLTAVLTNLPVDTDVCDVECFDMHDFNSSSFTAVEFTYDAKWFKNTHDATISFVVSESN